LPSIIPQWLQDLNTVLGIAGFLITAIVMFQVAAIRRSFKSRAILPDLIKELQKTGSNLNVALEGWPARRNDARSHVKIGSALIESAIPLVNGDLKRNLKSTHLKLSMAAKEFDDAKYQDPDVAWDIYSDIQQSITSLGQFIRNLKWE